MDGRLDTMQVVRQPCFDVPMDPFWVFACLRVLSRIYIHHCISMSAFLLVVPHP